jgi:hypothetical protein
MGVSQIDETQVTEDGFWEIDDDVTGTVPWQKDTSLGSSMGKDGTFLETDTRVSSSRIGENLNHSLPPVATEQARIELGFSQAFHLVRGISNYFSRFFPAILVIAQHVLEPIG